MQYYLWSKATLIGPKFVVAYGVQVTFMNSKFCSFLRFFANFRPHIETKAAPFKISRGEAYYKEQISSKSSF